jgi:hypothetical protein
MFVVLYALLDIHMELRPGVPVFDNRVG